MSHLALIQPESWLAAIPSDWRTDRLKDIVPQIVGGGTPESWNPDFWDDGDIVWVTPTDFSNDCGKAEICDSDRKITRAGLSSCAAALLPKDAVIMASRATIGAVRIAGAEMATNQGFVSFVCDERRLHYRFLYYVILGNLGDYFAEIAPGTTFCEISRGDAKLEPIGFPQLPEQKRIAAYLDATCATIDAAVATKRRQIEKLDAVRRATIQKAIATGLISSVRTKTTGIQLIETIPAHWRLDRLKDVASINSSSLAANTDPTYEFDYLEISNVDINGIIDANAIEHMRFKDAPSRARRCVSKNTTLVSSVRPNLQAVLFVSENRLNFVCSTGFNVVQPNESKLRPKFIYYALISDTGRQHFEATAKGVGYPAVDDKDFGSLIVPLPPLDEQEAICVYLDTKLGEIKNIVTCIKTQIATLTTYRKSLIHECVTGQRRVLEADLKKVKTHG